MAYRNAPALLIPREVEIPTCDRCGETYDDAATARRLDEALEPIYRERLAEIARNALDSLRDVISKRELEASLGLSQGYLSKLPEKPTSAILVSLLALIAADPDASLEIVRKLWGRKKPRKKSAEERR